MARTTASALALIVVAPLAFLAGTLYHHPREIVTAAGGGTPLYYHCPMHPSYRSDVPGTAPCCGMALEPVFADAPAAAAPAPGTVKIAAGTQQLIGVRVAAVERTAGTDRLRLSGRVAADQTRVYRLNAGLAGYVREMSSATAGSRVSSGQWLATFSTPDARQAIGAYLQSLDVLDREEQLAASAIQVTAARLNRQLAADRLLTYGMSPLQLEEIARTRQAPLGIKVTAPVSGLVLARRVSTGETFEAGTELFQIADLTRVWIFADVAGADAGELRPGAAAAVRLPGHHSATHARVSDVLPQFDTGTSTLKVRLEADNPGLALRPDMFVDVELAVTFEPATVVPIDALLDTGLRKTVFVERSEGVFEPREVVTGWRSGSLVQILEGLEPGERIVTSGTFLVDSESRLKAAGARPAAGAGSAPVAASGLAIDPICHMEVQIAAATAAGLVTTRAGGTHYFCAKPCKLRFDGARPTP